MGGPTCAGFPRAGKRRTRGMQRGVEEYGVGSRGRRGWRR